MKRLWHWPIDPLGRTVRLVLGEKGWTYESIEIKPWVADLELTALAPGARAPAFLNTDSATRICAIGSLAICSYIEETQPNPRLFPFSPAEKAEARRLWQWGEEHFAGITNTLLAERAIQWVRRDRAPNSQYLRQGAHALKHVMSFLDTLAGERPYLAGRHLTLADFGIAAHLSAYDYFGDVPWDLTPELKSWYNRIKSRPCFKTLLEDRIGNARPARHYADLDF